GRAWQSVCGIEYDRLTPMQTLRVNSIGSSPQAGSGIRKPRQSRRWLKQRVTKAHQLRLAPARPKPRRLGVLDCWDRARNLARAWWMWLALTLGLLATGNWHFAMLAGSLSFILYHTAPQFHPA